MSYKGEAQRSGDFRHKTTSQTIEGSGSWDGVSDVIYVRGSGPRTIKLVSARNRPHILTVLDADGTAGAGPIQIEALLSSDEGSDSLTENFSSITLITNEAELHSWVPLTRPLSHLEHKSSPYLLRDGSQPLTGDLLIGSLDIPSQGYVRVSRRGQRSFDLLTSTLEDGETLRSLISVALDSFRFHTSARSPLEIYSDTSDSPLRFSSGGNLVDTGLRGPTHNIFTITSVNAAKVSTHQYGPTASAGTALNLNYRAGPAATVAGLGINNSTDNIRFLVKGLRADGTSFIFRGLNASNSTVFSVSDLGVISGFFSSPSNLAQLKVEPSSTALITSQEDASTQDYFLFPSLDGVSSLPSTGALLTSSVILKVRLGVSSAWRTFKADFEALTSDSRGNLEILGPVVPSATGDSSGLEVSVTPSGSKVKVTLSNSTGETLTGYVLLKSMVTSWVGDPPV